MKREDRVDVQRMKPEKGGIGQSKYVPDGDPVELACDVYPLDTSLSVDLGLQEYDTRLVATDDSPTAPVGIHDEISFEDAKWILTAPPKHFRKTWGLRRWEFIIRKV